MRVLDVKQSDALVWLIDSRTVNESSLITGFFLLNSEEIDRYNRFVRPQRQRQFLIGRILLRFALSSLLRVPAESIFLIEQTNNAPKLQWPDPAPGFSLSHSEHWVACAVSLTRKLGLDIEVIDRSRDVLALSEHIFECSDIKRLHSLPQNERLNLFYDLWSSKEAKYKLLSNRMSETEFNPQCVAISHPSLSIVLASDYSWTTRPKLFTLTELAYYNSNQ